MLRRPVFPLLPALAVAAMAVTGCGGSSKKSTTSTVSTTSTASGATSGGAGTSGLNTSTLLNSPLAQRLFREEAITHGLPSSEATKFVTCLENKFAAQGLRTFGDAAGNSSRTKLDSAACALNVKTGG
ncbi:MAG TPA: hypothetical protein VE983_13010 [Solirubrobacteraceae bacterium]|nr:hypothetical protein [Solirubrobacteraceae bacterium]